MTSTGISPRLIAGYARCVLAREVHLTENDQTHNQLEHLDAVVAWVNQTVDPAD